MCSQPSGCSRIRDRNVSQNDNACRSGQRAARPSLESSLEKLPRARKLW
jgi:hypothetical protein